MSFTVFFFRLNHCINPPVSARLKATIQKQSTSRKRLLTNKEGIMGMRRNRKNNIKKERIIMIASSAFVLAALTMTGVYMKQQNAESNDDGYSMDFAALEDSADNKYQEIAQNNTSDLQGNAALEEDGVNQANMDDDLDYMPLEAGSSLVEIPGLTDGKYSVAGQETVLEGLEDVDELADGGEVLVENDADEDSDDAAEDADGDEKEDDEEASAQDVVVSKELHFSEDNGLVRPTAGDILMNYSMDGSIYFATLDQYKYNPAVVFTAEEGSIVSACAEGKVVDIYDDAQIGKAVTIDLGDGYEATYGQLKEIQVSVGSYVNPGDAIGSVAAPTKYYSVEGSNLYFQLEKDGTPVNPENLF